MKSTLLAIAVLLSLNVAGQGSTVSTTTPILDISVGPYIEHYYDLIISDSTGRVLAHKKDDKWAIIDAEAALEVMSKELDRLSKESIRWQSELLMK